MTSLCRFFRSVSLSSTMSLTLLSLWLTRSWQKQLAAARTAVGDWLSETRVTAASYTTAVEVEVSRARMTLR